MDPETGIIKTLGDLDRESVASYEFAVYVTDGSFHFDTCLVLVNILDINDHSPKFRDSCYPMHVPENTDLGEMHTLVASDEDIGSNADIMYSITGKKCWLTLRVSTSWDRHGSFTALQYHLFPYFKII